MTKEEISRKALLQQIALDSVQKKLLRQKVLISVLWLLLCLRSVTEGVVKMGKSNINIRMDSELKKQFKSFCADMGMTMTTAFNLFAKKTVQEYRIPFDVGAEIPNEETKEAMEEVRRMKADSSIGKAYTDVDTMMEDLLQ